MKLQKYELIGDVNFVGSKQNIMYVRRSTNANEESFVFVVHSHSLYQNMFVIGFKSKFTLQ